MLDLSHNGVEMYLIIGTVLALAATLQSMVGFGFNLFAAPLLIFFLKEPDEVVPALHISWLLVGLAICFRCRHQINPRRITYWFFAALPGTVVGVWLLAKLNPTFLSRVIGIVTIAAVLLITFKSARPFKHEKAWTIAAAGLSGMLSSSTAMAGPPLVLLGLNQNWSTIGFRADLLAYFTLLSAAIIGLYWWQGMLTAIAFRYAAAGLPGLCVGFFVGALAAKTITGKRFRYVALVLICVASVISWLG